LKRKKLKWTIFPDNFVIASRSDTFDKIYVCKSWIDIRKGSVSKDGDGVEFKLKNTGKYVASEDDFGKNLEPKMQIIRGLYEFSIEGDQLFVFH